MKRTIRIALLIVVMACLLLQVVGAETAPSTLGTVGILTGEEKTGHAGWISSVHEDKDSLKEVIEEETAEKEDVADTEELEEVYVSPSTGVGAAATIACVSAAGLVVAKLTKKREQ